MFKPISSVFSGWNPTRRVLPNDVRATHFDAQGRFVVPDDCRAETTEDAQLWAARALDSLHEIVSCFNRHFGDPGQWTKELIELLGDLYGFVGNAVVASYGRDLPRYLFWPALSEELRLHLPLDDLMFEAFYWYHRGPAQSSHPFTISHRAHAVCWMQGVVEVLKGMVRSKAWAGSKVRRTFDLTVAAMNGFMSPKIGMLQGVPAVQLILAAKRLHQMAEVYAALGDSEARRISGITAFLLQRLGDQEISVVAPLEVHVASECRAHNVAGELFRGVSVPPEMTRDDTMADQFLTLCRELAAREDSTPRERAGAALLASALLVGRGAKRPGAASHVEALERCWRRAPEEPEPFQNAPLNRWFPELRFHRWVRRALDALGHESDDFAAALLRRGKRKTAEK